MTREDGRSYDALRPVSIEANVQRNPEGSVIYRCGGTTVLIAASVSEGVPDWMRGSGSGWLTAEYAMHPRVQDKAQTAKNGLVLLKGCNTVLGHLGSSLRASREAVVRGVTPLGKDQPLPARRALRPTTSQLAELIIISLKEYQCSVNLPVEPRLRSPGKTHRETSVQYQGCHRTHPKHRNQTTNVR